MKLVSVGIAVVGLALLASLTPGRVDASHAQSVLRQSVNEAAALKNVVVQDARKEHGWMLLLGMTIVCYRLMRKHQAMFENSLLYPSAYDGQRFADDIAADTLELSPMGTKRVA